MVWTFWTQTMHCLQWMHGLRKLTVTKKLDLIGLSGTIGPRNRFENESKWHYIRYGRLTYNDKSFLLLGIDGRFFDFLYEVINRELPKKGQLSWSNFFGTVCGYLSGQMK